MKRQFIHENKDPSGYRRNPAFTRLFRRRIQTRRSLAANGIHDLAGFMPHEMGRHSRSGSV